MLDLQYESTSLFDRIIFFYGFSISCYYYNLHWFQIIKKKTFLSTIYSLQSEHYSIEFNTLIKVLIVFSSKIIKLESMIKLFSQVFLCVYISINLIDLSYLDHFLLLQRSSYLFQIVLKDSNIVDEWLFSCELTKIFSVFRK